MNNKKNNKVGMLLLNLLFAFLIVFFFEVMLETASDGKRWFFISIPLGIGFFVIRQRMARSGSVNRLDMIRQRMYTEGKTEEVIEELENILIQQYNIRHSIRRADRSIFESDKLEIFSEDWTGLELLAEAYAETGKEDRAIRIMEQIHDSTEFHITVEVLPLKYQKTLFYLTALEIFMEAGDMNKTEAYLFEAKPYLELFKKRKDNMGACICLTHVRYQYLKGNYTQALQWLNNYVFPEEAEIQFMRRELAACLYYALGDGEQSGNWLKQAEDVCGSQWRKDKLYMDYEKMAKYTVNPL